MYGATATEEGNGSTEEVNLAQQFGGRGIIGILYGFLARLLNNNIKWNLRRTGRLGWRDFGVILLLTAHCELGMI